MINYIELYKKMQNPLSDDLIRYFVSHGTSIKNIHNSIVSYHKKQHQMIFSNSDELYKKLYLIWRNNVLKLSDHYIDKLIDNGTVNTDYLNLKQILLKYPIIKTKQEYIELLKKEKLIDKYGWHQLGNDINITYINSSLLNVWCESSFNVEHKLCLNCNSDYVVNLVDLLMEECSNHHLPFYIRFNESENVDDSVTIYSNTANLKDYVNIIKKIVLSNKVIYSNLNEAPILTGKIEPWLGYASETNNYMKSNFEEVRALIISFSIDNCTREWIYNNRNTKIKTNNSEMFLINFVTKTLVDSIIMDYKKQYIEFERESKEKDFYEFYGLTKETLKSNELKERMYSELILKMPQVLESYYKNKTLPFIDIKTENNKRIAITINHMKKVIDHLSKQILKSYPSFMNNIKEQITHLCQNYGIDSEKFCFDLKRRNDLFWHEKRTTSKKR